MQGIKSLIGAGFYFLLASIVEGIKIDPKDSHEEKQWCNEILMLYVALYLTISCIFFLMSFDAHLENGKIKCIVEMLIGCIFAIIGILIFEYGRGFFVKGQDSSFGLTCLTLLLQFVGFVFYVVITIGILFTCAKLDEQRKESQRRLNTVSAMRG